MTVPAKTFAPGRLMTGTDSPVSEAWLTATSPETISPSNGITLPVRTTMRSPEAICDSGTETSVPSFWSHTRLTPSDMVRARSSTDFLCVHSSSSSPSWSRNMTEPAVPKSRRAMDTPMDRASSTSTRS